MKKSYFLSLIFALFVIKAIAQPLTAAPTPPARATSNVISIYSGAYTDVAGTDFFPNWGQSTTVSDFTISGDVSKKYSNFNYQGWQLSSPINVSTMTNLHIDIWTADATAFEVFLISPGPVEQAVNVPPTVSGWKSIDIPLSSYTTPAKNNIVQFKFVTTPFGGTPGPTVYIDNVYFWTNSTLPTITGFSVPSKVLGNAPFAITAPTSNSTGAFTYTSSNTDVATIAGNTITIVGSGTSSIIANQAAAGIYAAGSASAPLVVTFNPPTTGPTAPTTAPANVISLFSDTYTNRTVDTWSTSWGSATLKDTTAGGNNIKRYSSLNFCGIEFTGANSVNATTMNFFNFDIWTPNPSPVKVKLVDFGANNSFDGGDDKSSIELVLSPSPTPGTWVRYSIPFSSFTGLTTRANLSQLLFVGSNTTIFIDNVFFSTVISLPVSLTSFTATKNGNSALLAWSTSSEINNKGFGVERSADGLVWSQLGFINGNGNSTTTQQYTYQDKNPLSGINYYRLKQVDNDGKQTYSSTVNVNFSSTDKVGFSFYPNPVRNKIMVSLQDIQGSAASLTLVNVNGKTVKTIALTAQNAFGNVQINVSDVAKGNYFLVLNDGLTIKTTKVLIN